MQENHNNSNHKRKLVCDCPICSFNTHKINDCPLAFLKSRKDNLKIIQKYKSFYVNKNRHRFKRRKEKLKKIFFNNWSFSSIKFFSQLGLSNQDVIDPDKIEKALNMSDSSQEIESEPDDMITLNKRGISFSKDQKSNNFFTPNTPSRMFFEDTEFGRRISSTTLVKESDVKTKFPKLDNLNFDKVHEYTYFYPKQNISKIIRNVNNHFQISPYARSPKLKNTFIDSLTSIKVNRYEKESSHILQSYIMKSSENFIPNQENRISSLINSE